MSDEWCEGWGQVALALEVDAVALYDSVLRHGEEEPVEFFESVGHAGKPPVGDPRALG